MKKEWLVEKDVVMLICNTLYGIWKEGNEFKGEANSPICTWVDRAILTLPLQWASYAVFETCRGVIILYLCAYSEWEK